VVPRRRARGLRHGLAEILGLEAEALLDEAEVLALHRRVAMRDGVEDGLETVLELARGQLARHGLNRLLYVEDEVVQVAARARLAVHPAEPELLQRVTRRGDGAVVARGREYLLVRLADVRGPVASLELPEAAAVVFEDKLGDLVEPQPLVREEAHHVEDGDAAVVRALLPESLHGPAHLDGMLPVVLALRCS